MKYIPITFWFLTTIPVWGDIFINWIVYKKFYFTDRIWLVLEVLIAFLVLKFTIDFLKCVE